MTRQTAKFQQRIKFDVMVLVVAAVIMIATALWLEPTKDGIVQRGLIALNQRASCCGTT